MTFLHNVCLVLMFHLNNLAYQHEVFGHVFKEMECWFFPYIPAKRVSHHVIYPDLRVSYTSPTPQPPSQWIKMDYNSRSHVRL